MRHFAAHFVPVTEVVDDVVATEREHRHGVAPYNAYLPGGRSRRLRAHTCAEKDSMGPVIGFDDQGYGRSAAAAEYDR